MEHRFTYICPIRMDDFNYQLIEELKEYWSFLNLLDCEVIVVDGSPEDIFEIHHREWSNCRHLRVNSKFTYLNGKVNGIFTGILNANHEKIILADDDVRYIEQDIEKMLRDLDEFDLVRPQNYFYPLPWWAKIDSARILLNQIFFKEGDFPGTCGFRKTIFMEAGPFDGDVLFDNEELVKHIRSQGANVVYSNGFFIHRNPPDFKKWIEQRPRQAYEDLEMKKRTWLSLSAIPLLLILGILGNWKVILFLIFIVSVYAVLTAYFGRHKTAKRYFPLQIIFYAPLWFVERAINVHIALYWRLMKGGCPFGEKRILKPTGEAWEKVNTNKKDLAYYTRKR